MTTYRDISDINSNPEGKSGAEWTTDARTSVKALWDLSGGVLLSPSGTNAITGTLNVSTGFTQYTDGFTVQWVQPATNTGAMTLNINGIGTKTLKGNGGDAVGAGTLTTGMLATAVFVQALDAFQLQAQGSTITNTLTGGKVLQLATVSRLAAQVAATTSATPIASQTFQCGYSDSRVIIRGNVSILSSAGTASATGLSVELYVDGEATGSTFTDYLAASSKQSAPIHFSYSPGDTDSHTYQVYATASIASLYPASSNWIVCSEVAPNA